MPYDILVCAQGEQPATFGVKGVEEYAFFMKEVRQLCSAYSEAKAMFVSVDNLQPSKLQCRRIGEGGPASRRVKECRNRALSPACMAAHAPCPPLVY